MEIDKALLADDVGKHIAEQMQAVLNRHIKTVATVLDASDIALMVTRIAAGVGVGAAFFAVQNRRDDSDIDGVFDMIVESVAKLMRASKPHVLVELAAAHAAAAEASNA